MRDAVPPVVDLVLVGGGHSHVQVLRSLGMRRLPGARVTIISREVFTPYSGMLPGHVAGYYAERDIHIDLGPLARFAGARLLAAEVTALDLDRQRIDLDGYPSVRFDVLSLNTGAVPAAVGDCGISVHRPVSAGVKWSNSLSPGSESPWWAAVPAAWNWPWPYGARWAARFISPW